MRILTSALFLALSAFLVLCAGCDQEASEVGVVARVNGYPIYLTDVEAKYDLSHLGWAGSVSPSLGKLKREYNDILAGLIVQELIFQVLDEKGFTVTNEEMLQTEARIRADYPKGMFEQVMIEEYIDLDIWRRQLRAHLAYEKFLNKILRPRITISKDGIQAYYEAHKMEFNVPARVAFLLVSGPDKEVLGQAVALFQQGADARKIERQLSGVKTQEIKIPLDQLTKKWASALQEVDPGDGSRVLSAQQGYELLILQDRQPARQLSVTEATPMIENVLMEGKLQQAYVAWLENEISGADIFVSQHLMATGQEAEDELEEQEPGKAIDDSGQPMEEASQESVEEAPVPVDDSQQPPMEELEDTNATMEGKGS